MRLIPDSILVTSVSEVASSQSTIAAIKMTVGPNPAKDMMLIQLEGKHKELAYEIIRPDGLILRQEKVVAQDTFQVNLEDLTKGAYFLRVISNQGMSVETFVIE